MNNRSKDRTIEILLIEDNPGDVRLTKEALNNKEKSLKISVVGDGVEAMAFLRREGRYVRAARPDLILLDLNLPKKGGHEVLAEIKDDFILRRIPVAILTTSDAEEDIFKSYDLHANCYITKPVDFEQFMRVIEFLEEFWLRIAKLPDGNNNNGGNNNVLAE